MPELCVLGFFLILLVQSCQSSDFIEEATVPYLLVTYCLVEVAVFVLQSALDRACPQHRDMC